MIYKLGEHILAQGDSTDPEFVSRVMKGRNREERGL